MPGSNPENEPVEKQYEEALLHGRHREPRPGAGSWAIWSGRCRPPSASPARAWPPTEWRGEPNLRLIDFACPFGGAKEAMQQLREETFKGREVKTVRQSADDRGHRIGVWAA